MIDVRIARPGTVRSRTSEGMTELDGVEARGYDRFARELEAAGDIRVSFVERLEVPGPPAILCSRYDMDLEDHRHPASSFDRTVLLDTPQNFVILVARLRLLGAVMESAFTLWESGRPYDLDRCVMARRDIAESMNAVGGRVYTLDEYCYLHRGDWTSLPQVLNHYLRRLGPEASPLVKSGPA